jgi:hypothetical protein
MEKCRKRRMRRGSALLIAAVLGTGCRPAIGGAEQEPYGAEIVSVIQAHAGIPGWKDCHIRG